jgi:hypothetical protein
MEALFDFVNSAHEAISSFFNLTVRYLVKLLMNFYCLLLINFFSVFHSHPNSVC